MKALARPGVALPGGRATPGDRVDKFLTWFEWICYALAATSVLVSLLSYALSDSFRS